MKFCHEYLVSQGKANSNMHEFKKQLYQIWFTLYRREGVLDSSGFEHVFVGEVKDNKIIGFHNWIQFFLEEKKRQVDYKGFILPKTTGSHKRVSEDEQLISIQFSWHSDTKEVSSIFIGTSPEFELALYTLCFLAGGDENDIVVGPYHINLKCYRIKSVYGDKLQAIFLNTLDPKEEREAQTKPEQNHMNNEENNTQNHLSTRQKPKLTKSEESLKIVELDLSSFKESGDEKEVPKSVKEEPIKQEKKEPIEEKVKEEKKDEPVKQEKKEEKKEEESSEKSSNEEIPFDVKPGQGPVPLDNIKIPKWGNYEESIAEKLAREEEIRKQKQIELEKKAQELEEKRRAEMQLKRKQEAEQKLREAEERRRMEEKERKQKELVERRHLQELERKREEKKFRQEMEEIRKSQEMEEIKEVEKPEKKLPIKKNKEVNEKSEKKKTSTLAKKPSPPQQTSSKPQQPAITSSSVNSKPSSSKKRKNSFVPPSQLTPVATPLTDEHSSGLTLILTFLGLFIVIAAILFERQ